jgi:hypothetical protein
MRLSNIATSKYLALFLLTLLLSLKGIAQTPTFGNTGAITLCVNGSYYLNPSITDGTFSTLSSTIATVNSSGYVTGVSSGSTTVSLVATGGGTVTASVTVAENANPSLSITDPLAQPSYKFNNNPQGPIGGLNNYVGYNGYDYSSQARPSNTGFFRASNQLGDAAGCPYEYYIFRCTTCGTVPEYATRPQGTISGNTISQGGTGQLTYTSSNGGGPFTISYLPSGGSNVTVNNISSTVAFNVASGTGTPITTTTYNLISVTDENTKATTDFSGIAASVTVNIPHYVGESYGGGIVFYITDGGAHGLIAATSDQGPIKWYNTGYSTTGAAATAIGTGLANTNTIINSQAGTATSYAAGLARAYTVGGYTDWYLPSKDELNLMYANIGKGASSPNYNIGGFADNYYWSSTEFNNFYAWNQGFSDGDWNIKVKYYPVYVRAIRAF